jgi:hypothetical protein
MTNSIETPSFPATTPDELSVLTHSHARATKHWRAGVSGKDVCDGYGKGKHFKCDIFPVSDLPTLAATLEALTECPMSFVIRGAPIAGRDLSRILRTKKLSKGNPPGFREVARRWACIDADKILPPEELAGMHLLAPEDCEAAARKALRKLPTELRDVTTVAQLSSSAGIGSNGLSVHFWFWLDRPMNEAELTRWAEAVNDTAGRKLVDPATFRTVQPLYVAHPTFDGVNDPVAKRLFILEGSREEASLPRLTQRADGWLRKLDPLKDPRTQEIHPHIRNATASYFCARGPNDPAHNLLATLRARVDEAIELRGEDKSETIYTDEKLLEYIDSGREFARDRAAQGENIPRGIDGTPKASVDNVRRLLMGSAEWNGVLAYNLRKDCTVLLAPPPFEDSYKGPPRGYPCAYQDVDDMRIVSWLASKHEMQAHPSMVPPAVSVIAHQNAFDPIVDYLNGLEWDGTPRLDTWLIDYLGVEDSHYGRRVAAMWMIAAVARALDPGCKADCVLSIEGEQGKRKSMTLETLAGGLEYFREGIGDIRSKDTWMAMQSAWIIELRELANVSNREAEAVKNFLDRRNDHYRGSYDRRPSDHRRRCIFAATTNQLSYLNDETGARRWWPVRARKTDLDRLRAVRDQLWAEAVARYHAREPWWVEADDPDFVAEQEARFESDSWETTIEAALKSGARSLDVHNAKSSPIPANCQKVTVTQVLEHVFGEPSSRHQPAAQKRVGRVLTRLRWESKSVNGERAWRPRSAA